MIGTLWLPYDITTIVEQSEYSDGRCDVEALYTWNLSPIVLQINHSLFFKHTEAFPKSEEIILFLTLLKLKGL